MNSIQKNQLTDAIKVNLLEFTDDYNIDDHLIDYIMSMIRNENTVEQMAEDLAPFIGDNALNFSTWLNRKMKETNAYESISNSNEELDIQIDTNEFNEDLNSSNEENKRTFAGIDNRLN